MGWNDLHTWKMTQEYNEHSRRSILGSHHLPFTYKFFLPSFLPSFFLPISLGPVPEMDIHLLCAVHSDPVTYYPWLPSQS